MRKIAILLALVLVLSVPLSAADAPQEGSENISLATYPQITIPWKNNTTFNITYSGVGISIPILGVKGIEPFEKRSWAVSNSASGNVSYNTNISLSDALNLGDSTLNSLSKPFKSALEDNNFNVTVYVNFSRYSSAENSLNAYNGSFNNVSVNSLVNNTIEINTAIVAHFSIPVNARLFLIQQISGFDKNLNHNMSFTQFVAHTRNSSTSGYGIALGSQSNLSHAKGLYWWTTNYSLNKSLQPLATTLLVSNGNPYLIFTYNLPANRSGIFQQDPFFTMLGGSLGSVQFVKKGITVVANYILENAEYFSIGLVLGSILIIGAYSGYRRNRY